MGANNNGGNPYHDPNNGQFIGKEDYVYISRQTMDNSPAARRVREYILSHGRGLGYTKNLSEEQKQILSLMQEKAIESPQDFMVYRTDDSHWLQNYEIGQVYPIQNILQTSYIEGYTIEENEGRVAQESYIQIPKGTLIFSPFTGSEGEIDILGNQNFRVNSRSQREDGKYSYRLEILRNRGM